MYKAICLSAFFPHDTANSAEEAHIDFLWFDDSLSHNSKYVGTNHYVPLFVLYKALKVLV